MITYEDVFCNVLNGFINVYVINTRDGTPSLCIMLRVFTEWAAAWNCVFLPDPRLCRTSCCISSHWTISIKDLSTKKSSLLSSYHFPLLDSSLCSSYFDRSACREIRPNRQGSEPSPQQITGCLRGAVRLSCGGRSGRCDEKTEPVTPPDR